MNPINFLMARNRSIGNRIIIPVNLFIAVFLVVVGYVQISNQTAVLKSSTDKKIESVAAAVEVPGAIGVKNQDKVTLAKIAKQLIQGRVVDGIAYYDNKGSIVFESLAPGVIVNQTLLSRDLVDDEGIMIGRMDLTYNYDAAMTEARQSVSIVIGVVLGIQVLMSIMILLLVRRIVQPLNRMRHQLEKGTTVNEETSLTLKSSAEQLSSSSAAQASSVQESVSAMAEMKSMISQTAGHVNECQKMSETVRGRTQDGSRIMGDMGRSMESIERSNQQLAGLVEIIGEIRNKTKIINDIVFKTQLLSFNASIEAARAGQHGRGFAVVAEEVGNLAQMSGKASKEIENLLANSHQQVHGMIDDVQTKVKEGKEVTEEALGTFNDISEQIVSISDKIRQIGDATKEQELGVEETSKSMTELDRTAQNNNQAARNMSSLAEKAKVQGEELRKIAQGLQTLVVGKRGLRELGKTPFRNTDYWGDKKDEMDPGKLQGPAQAGDMVSLVDRILTRHKGKAKPQVGIKEDQVGRLDRKVVNMSGINADDESFKKKEDQMKLNPADERLLFDMICNLTGAAYEEDFRREMIMNNIGFRMQSLKISHLKGYLEQIERDEGEFDHLISLSTIHTTAWFREKGHFDFLYKLAMSCDNHALNPLRLWFSACSTGQEAYTAGMVLERVRQHRPSFEYRILGSDIDVISLNYARQAIYPTRKLSEIPREFQEYILEGSGKTDGLFTIAKEIRDRTAFRRIDLNHLAEAQLEKFDVIACRNVLIYFKSAKLNSIVANQQEYLKEGGHFIVGHCEAVEASDYDLTPLGGSVYRRQTDKGVKEKWVLVVDDSPTYRRFLVKHLESWGFGVVQAASAAEAEIAIHQRKFDLITLDLHMPDRSGGEWIEDVRKRNVRTPVVIVSEAHPKEAFKVVEVLERDSVEFLDKVTVSARPEVLRLTAEGVTRQAEGVKRGKSGDTDRVSLGLRKAAVPEAILIGASTGGPQALTRILKNWPKPSPPIVVVQHISKNFLRAFAERLAQVSGLELGDPVHDPILKMNHIYLALDDYHLHLGRGAEQFTIRPYRGEATNGHRPSVDELFLSAVGNAQRVCSVILTGMGADGARGMVELRKGGALTLGQDEGSCVVYGMPKEAFNNGGVEHVGDVDFIRQSLLDLVTLPARKAAG